MVESVAQWCDGLLDVDPVKVVTTTINGLYDGVPAHEVDRLLIQVAAELTAEEPQYSRLAARLLSKQIAEEVRSQGVTSFSEAVALGHDEGLIGDVTAAFVAAHSAALDDAIDEEADRRFEYFGLRTVYDRYLLRHPRARMVFETPQYWLLRVACGLSGPSTKQSGSTACCRPWPTCRVRRRCSTRGPGTRNCHRVSWSTRRATNSIPSTSYAQVAKLSKFAGGIGIGFSRVRSRGR